MAVTAAKACTECKAKKPLADFPRNPQSRDGHHTRCKACKNARAAGYYRRWTPEQREEHRARVLRTRYGLEMDLLIAMYERQEGCCAICGTPGDRPATNERDISRGILCVDHDHATGAVRGLLCNSCNTGLGKFNDNVASLIKAADYLLGRDDLSL